MKACLRDWFATSLTGLNSKLDFAAEKYRITGHWANSVSLKFWHPDFQVVEVRVTEKTIQECSTRQLMEALLEKIIICFRSMEGPFKISLKAGKIETKQEQ